MIERQLGQTEKFILHGSNRKLVMIPPSPGSPHPLRQPDDPLTQHAGDERYGMVYIPTVRPLTYARNLDAFRSVNGNLRVEHAIDPCLFVVVGPPFDCRYATTPLRRDAEAALGGTGIRAGCASGHPQLVDRQETDSGE